MGSPLRSGTRWEGTPRWFFHLAWLPPQQTMYLPIITPFYRFNASIQLFPRGESGRPFDGSVGGFLPCVFGCQKLLDDAVPLLAILQVYMESCRMQRLYETRSWGSHHWDA